MKINKEWHHKNPMPKNATLQQRVAWHLAHSKHCECRPIPLQLQNELKKNGIKF